MTKKDIKFIALNLSLNKDVVIKSKTGIYYKIVNDNKGFKVFTISDIENNIILSSRLFKDFNDLLMFISKIEGKFI